MYDIFANNIVPKGTYICTECGCMQEHDKKALLPACPDCGGEKFRATVYVTLTQEQIEEKFKESIKLLAEALYLFEECGLAEFLNVISINLRMLLCDGEHSLLPKVIENPKFNRAYEKYENNVLLPSKLLENPIMPLPLDEFLEQIVIKRPGGRPITVKKMIRASANKCGGAHVDTEMEEDFFISSGVSKYYFSRIAKYIINMSGMDYEEITEKLRNSINADRSV